MKQSGKRGALVGTVLLLGMGLVTAACGGASDTFSKIGSGLSSTSASDHTGAMPYATSAEAGGAFDAPPDKLVETGGATSGGMALAGATSTAGTNSSALAPEGSGTTGTTSGAGGDTVHMGTAPQSNYQSPLTAGQVDDNAKFDDYMQYLRSYGGGYVHPIDVSQRLFVRVVDNAQKPVAGARVQLTDGQSVVFDGQTVSDGRVLFFPAAAGASQARSLHAVVSRGNARVESDVKLGGPEPVVTLGGVTDNTGPVALDLVFLLDATGSMDDEINQIKATVGSIAERIEQLPGSSKPRFGLVAFRDRGDDYVTRAWDFTGDINQFSSNLANVQAGGGGDNPESVNAGLHDAINLPGWADNASGRHLRMVVLVGDAPPHLDYPNDYEYTSLLQDAVRKGIKIFPIGASGLGDQGEYIFRQFAQVTQGQFVFLTYANGVSGQPGMATDHHVDDFTVQHLDTLVVNLVAGEIANQTGQKVQPMSDFEPVPVAPTHRATDATGAAPLTFSDVAGRLFNWSTVLWLLFIVGLFAVAPRTAMGRGFSPLGMLKVRRGGQTAQPTMQDAEDAPLPDITQPEDDFEYVPLAPHMQQDIAEPEGWVRWLDQPGQPTVALPAFEEAARKRRW